MSGLEEILKYRMNEAEAKAYKIALLWMTLAKKEFPEYPVGSLRQSGDPRKSHLFKICYKLSRELKDFPEDQFDQYIMAQLQMLKELKEGDVHAMINPNILVGERAWVRWKMWKRKFDKALPKAMEAGGQESRLKIKSDLERAKNLFLENFGRIPTYEDVKVWIQDKNMVKWVSMGKLTPYYILLCPHVKAALGDGQFNVQFDLDIYRSSVTPEVVEDYKEIFGDL